MPVVVVAAVAVVIAGVRQWDKGRIVLQSVTIELFLLIFGRFFFVEINRKKKNEGFVRRGFLRGDRDGG